MDRDNLDEEQQLEGEQKLDELHLQMVIVKLQMHELEQPEPLHSNNLEQVTNGK